MADEIPSDPGPRRRSSSLDRFLAELKRRRMYRVGVGYVVAAFGVLEGLDIILPAISAPAWVMSAAVVTVLMAFPVTIALGWVFDVGPDGVRRTVGATDGEVPEVRRWVRVAFAMAIVGVVVGGGSWWLRPMLLSGAVAAGADVIAVVPFSASGPGTESLGEGMVDLLSTNLDEVGAIRTADSRSVLRAWERQVEAASADRDGALAVAREVDAGSVVLGSVVATGSEVQLDAKLYTVDGYVLATARVRGQADQMLALVDSLTIQLVRGIWRSREPLPSFRVAAVTTGSLDAIRQYLEAESWYRRSQWDSAVVYYSAAVAEDSTFALAHHRLASSYGWLDLLGSATASRHALAAYELRDRLPDREKSLVQMDYLFYEGDFSQALDSALAFVGRSPGDAEGWFRVGDYQFHSDLRYRLPRDDLIAPFDRVLALDGTLTPALFHPIDLALAAADRVLFNRYLAVVDEYSTAQVAYPLEMAAELVWTSVSPDSLPELIRRIHAVRPGLLNTLTAAIYRSELSDPADYLGALRTFLGGFPEGSRERAVLPMMELGLLTSQGRFDEARPLMGGTTGGGRASTQFLMYPVVAGLADTTILGSGPVLDAIPEAWDTPRAALWTALVELGAGNPAAARSAVQSWELAVPAGTDSLTDAYHRALRGWISFSEDRTPQGVADLLSGVEALSALAPATDLSFLELLRLRAHEALASSAEGREEAILRLAQFVARDPHVDVAQWLVTGEALEAAGRPEEAATQYRRFLDILKNADPSARDVVARAEEGLARVVGAVGP